MQEHFKHGFEKTAFGGKLIAGGKNLIKSVGQRFMPKTPMPKPKPMVPKPQPQPQQVMGNNAMQPGRFAKMQQQKNLAKAKAQKDQAMRDAIAKSRAKKDALAKQRDAQVMQKMRNRPQQAPTNRTPSYEASVDKAIANARSDQAARSAKIKTEAAEKVKARKAQEAAVAKQKARAEARAEANRIKNQRPTPGKVKTPFIEENKRRARKQELSNLDAFNPGRM